MTEKQALAILKQPNGSETLARQAEEAFAPSLSLLAQEEAAAAAFLVRLAKQKKYREEINHWLGDRRLLYRLIASGDAKLRKNTARLMGQLGVAEDAPAIMEALTHECVRMVRPSMILALGALKTPEAAAYLQAYAVEPAAEESEKKHQAAEQEALRTVLAGLRSKVRHAFRQLPPRTPLELRCGRGLERVLEKELQDAGVAVRSVAPGRVSAVLSKWQQLQSARAWREALLPLSKSAALSAESIAQTAIPKMQALLSSMYAGEPPYAFRVELGGAHAALTKEIARALEGKFLVNAPSGYEVELRVEVQKGEKVALYLKLFNAPDARFAYRKGAVPASIHPANAAGVVQLAARYLKPKAVVMDPCCGSGTLLIERGLYGPCQSITGVDIQGKALQVAKENLMAAKRQMALGSVARLVRSDFLQYEPSAPVDELFANLPFGNRVGSHEENKRLYMGLAQRLPRWVKPGGIAVLYTMEGKLLEQCIYSQRKLQILERHRVEAGGLEPKVLIIRVLA